MKWLNTRRAKKVKALDTQIDAITAKLSDLAIGYPLTADSIEKLRRRRVKLYWRRNDLYTKLKESY